MQLVDNFDYGVKWFIEGVMTGDWFRIVVGGGLFVVGIVMIKYLFAAVDESNKDLKKVLDNKNQKIEILAKSVNVPSDYKHTLSYKAGKLYASIFKKR
jgi:hypothetical protein